MEPQDKPDISVMTVNYNNGVSLPSCISSVLNSDDVKVECIVIDNGSTDGSREFLLQYPDPRLKCVCSEKNVGLTKGWNLGARMAKGRFLLFLDPDVRLDKDCLAQLMQPLTADPRLGSCQAKSLKMDNPQLIDSYAVGKNGKIRSKPQELFPSSREILYPATCFMLTTCVYRSLDGIDEGFFSDGFDIDLGWRLRMQGYKVVMIPHAVAYHERGTLRTLYAPVLRRKSVVSYLRLWFKNLETIYLLRNLPSILMAVFLRCLRDLFHRRYESFLGVLEFATGFQEVAMSRALTQHKRIVSDKLLLPYLKHLLPTSPQDIRHITKTLLHIH